MRDGAVRRGAIMGFRPGHLLALIITVSAVQGRVLLQEPSCSSHTSWNFTSCAAESEMGRRGEFASRMGGVGTCACET